MKKHRQFELAPNVRIVPAKEDKIMVERVGIYARVSTAGREQLKSLAAQISGLTRMHRNRRIGFWLMFIWILLMRKLILVERNLTDC